VFVSLENEFVKLLSLLTCFWGVSFIFKSISVFFFIIIFFFHVSEYSVFELFDKFFFF
jgi:hypothetical protein